MNYQKKVKAISTEGLTKSNINRRINKRFDK